MKKCVLLAPAADATSPTVNSSPCAVEIYRHMGFTATSGELPSGAIRYTPMEYRL